MAKTFSELQDRKQTHVKIGNYYIKKKTLLIIGVLLVIAVVAIKYNNYKAEKELQQRLLNAQALSGTSLTQEEQKYISLHDQIQMQLREQYGIPPEGFEWDYDGSLVTLSTLEDMTAEDVVYTYVQSVHMLDFATAQRVASSSTIIDTYTDYYDTVSSSLLDIDDAFKRKEYKLALNKMSADRVVDFVVMADGSMIYTMEITCLDLTNKDFWLDDEQNIYNTMYAYDKTELDSTKKEQFLYDYVYDAYVNDKCGYHTVNVDLVVTKSNGGGWLVSDDTELRKVLLYEYGLDVVSYINTKYEQFLLDYELHGLTDGDSGYSVTTPSDNQDTSGLYNTHLDDFDNKVSSDKIEKIVNETIDKNIESNPDAETENGNQDTSEELYDNGNKDYKDLSGRTEEDVKEIRENEETGHSTESGYDVTQPNK